MGFSAATTALEAYEAAGAVAGVEICNLDELGGAMVETKFPLSGTLSGDPVEQLQACLAERGVNLEIVASAPVAAVSAPVPDPHL